MIFSDIYLNQPNPINFDQYTLVYVVKMKRVRGSFVGHDPLFGKNCLCSCCFMLV